MVMLKEIHSAPIISQWVWYRVGSRNEVKGLTGISHWVEHMQFKGTERFPAGVLDKAISRDGGYWNAFTYMDWTAFYTTMPADKIDLPIALEADRMQNSQFLPEEVASERTVILSEREGSENSPTFKLEEAIGKAAFDFHPYREDVIGEKGDLLEMTRDDLYNHYRSYYHPNNAVLAMAGDFDSKEMLGKLQTAYRDVPAGDIPHREIKPEGPLTAEKRLQVSASCDVTFMKMVWRAPEGKSPDIFALTMLDSILSGPSPLNMFGGGGIGNKTSRLYKPLVQSQVAAAFFGDYSTTIDPYLYSLTVYLNQEHEADEAIAVIDRELERIRRGDITREEMDKALKQARAMFAYGSENITNQAYWMGYTEMFDHYSWFSDFVPSLEKVTREDIQAAAEKWLAPDSRVIGVCVPEED